MKAWIIILIIFGILFIVIPIIIAIFVNIAANNLIKNGACYTNDSSGKQCTNFVTLDDCNKRNGTHFDNFNQCTNYLNS
jgi:hypothetical protein